MGPAARQRYSIHRDDREQQLASFAEEVASGLTSPARSIPCRFLYDDVGSKLFEEICDVPEYYLTRAEREILEARAGEIAATFEGGPITLAEFGSGSSVKTRLLIEGLLHTHGRLRYLPVDISASILEESALELLDDYEALEVRAIASEYQDGLRHVHADQGKAKLVAWLGSSIGNLNREEATSFLQGVRRALEPRDRLLVGVDLRKDRETLEAAYDDAAGVTASFSLNLLARVNRELGGDFEVSAFRHRAVYDEDEGRVIIDLVSQRSQRVRIEEIGLDVSFAEGEPIHIEDSWKYSKSEIDALASRADLRTEKRWHDAAGRFSLNLLAPR
jgi:L-histidine N-alpha-methyltransferase